jgi:hypothetical protein
VSPPGTPVRTSRLAKRVQMIGNRPDRAPPAAIIPALTTAGGPIIGGIAWLVAGRPNTRRQSAWRVGNGFPEYERPRVAAPDDDPEFLANRKRADDEHEQALRRWEDDLRAREAELRRQDQEPGEEPDRSR